MGTVSREFAKAMNFASINENGQASKRASFYDTSKISLENTVHSERIIHGKN